MSKEMRKLIDDFKTFNNRKLNENFNNDLIKDIENSIDEKMNELVGIGDYDVVYNEDQKIFIVSFREGDVQTSCDMADEVVDYVNNEKERNIIRVGNCGKTEFWLTLINKKMFG